MVKKENLYSILLEFRIPKKLAGLIRMSLNDTKSRVRVGRQFSDNFEIHNGLKFVGKPEGKRPVGRPRMRWQSNINLI